MRLNCPHCDRQLSVADDKIPSGQRFKLVCPQCNKPFTVEPDSVGTTSDTNTPPSVPPSAPTADETDFYPPGAKIAFAFVRDPEWNAALTSSLGEQGYHLAVPGDTAEAIRKIDAAAYELVFIDHAPHGAEVLQRVHGWPGGQRRGVNVVLIGGEAKSLHPDASFRNGVNWYLHQNDVADVPRLVRTVIDGYEETSKMWRLAAEEASKPKN
ncbi:MJ0042-type zinc finger domain-containing protein [Desulfonatronum thiodismutans]|uniref:MJ0042-type zinc finger domain-containing protein n=1 Tax=Desulfonatronum thiodismutans TaxID=159290 RepID=UPI0004ABD56E|nr:MJ0042-type zinc finger domain-containing protein [Desulfonatronum thiodismutans]